MLRGARGFGNGADWAGHFLEDEYKKSLTFWRIRCLNLEDGHSNALLKLQISLVRVHESRTKHGNVTHWPLAQLHARNPLDSLFRLTVRAKGDHVPLRSLKPAGLCEQF